jgi:hypothetical protein
MRVDSSLLSQTQIESSKTLEKKEVTPEGIRQDTLLDEAQSFVPSPMGSSGTYSVKSLKAAVDNYAKFMTVAENNLRAAQHPAAIPQLLLDRLNGR